MAEPDFSKMTKDELSDYALALIEKTQGQIKAAQAYYRDKLGAESGIDIPDFEAMTKQELEDWRTHWRGQSRTIDEVIRSSNEAYAAKVAEEAAQVARGQVDERTPQPATLSIREGEGY